LIARAAVELLSERMRGTSPLVPPRQIVLPTRVIARTIEADLNSAV
jgi:DNA-binding LacI/PurR family transcriptional regulator